MTQVERAIRFNALHVSGTPLVLFNAWDAGSARAVAGEIAAIAAATPLRLNVMMSAASPPASALARAGVARISHGPGPYRQVMHALEEAARAAMAAAG